MTAPEAAPMREDVTQAVDPELVQRVRYAVEHPEAKGFALAKAGMTRHDFRRILSVLSAHTARPDDIDRLRKAVIEIGNMIPGCALADTVSTDFLMLIPSEVRAWKDKPTARPDTGDGWDAINRLRDQEADCVNVLCDNPDGPPNNAVECCGFWTGFADRRFEGETILEALARAVAAKDEADKVGHPSIIRPDAGDEIERLRVALKRCVEIVERYNGRQNEKIEDVKYIATAALAAMREGVDRGMAEREALVLPDWLRKVLAENRGRYEALPPSIKNAQFSYIAALSLPSLTEEAPAADQREAGAIVRALGGSIKAGLAE